MEMCKGHGRHLWKDKTQMANKYLKTQWTSPALREVVIKTTMIYHFTPTRQTKIIKLYNAKPCWEN